MTTTNDRLLGVMLVGADVQSEGVEPLLDDLVARTGATAVAINATVSEPSSPGDGSLAPPSDGGASKRVFDRPLWGKTSLWLRSAPAWEPRRQYYRGGAYQPRPSTPLTQSAGPLIGEFVAKAAERGLATYLQLSASSVPGLRDADVPRLPNGAMPDRMVNTASLASPALRDWNRAQARDALDALPGLTGVRLDFAESPCYKLQEAFTDFGEPMRDWCREQDIDFATMRDEIDRLYRFVSTGLDNAELTRLLESGPAAWLRELLDRFPAIEVWLAANRLLATQLVKDWRDTAIEHAGSDLEIAVNGFGAPLSTLTGFDIGELAKLGVSAVSPKLYAMHWSMMIEFWADEILRGTPGLDEGLLVRAMVALADLAEPATWADADRALKVSDYGYPEPDQAHPVGDGPLSRKLDNAVREAMGRTAVHPIVHGYGPVDDVRRRLKVVADSNAEGVWLNRYGYLSSEKLDIVGEVWHQSA